MYRFLTLCAVAALAVLASCVTDPAQHLQTLNNVCGNEGRPWTYLAAPPADAAAMREAERADQNPNDRLPAGEFWFSLPTGEIKLCHADPNLTNTCVGRWSEFRPGPAGPLLDRTKSGELICAG